MYTVTREFLFCYGHRLLGYDGKCARLHGHNGKLRVTIAAPSLDGVGMVIDFFDLKRTLGDWLDGELDHHMILRRDDPAARALGDLGEPVRLVEWNPTAENLARHVWEFVAREGLAVTEVSLEETPNCVATYRGEGP
jgi:6-pyruvoyltetrahydropterin/6-carboxytetrahydropterin synthase